MIKHYFKIAGAKIKNNVSYSMINVLGLGIATTVGIIILAYVNNEFSYDRFHDQFSEVYRVYLRLDIQGDVIVESRTSPAIGVDLQDNFPEVDKITRIFNWETPEVVWQGSQSYLISGAIYAECSFFDIFSFDLIHGDPSTALSEPFSLVLTESLALELFQKENPIGEVLLLGNEKHPYLVTGIIEDSRPDTHIKYQMLKSYPSLLAVSTGIIDEWDSNLSAFTYVRLLPGYDLVELRQKIDELAFEKVNYKFEGMGIHFGVDLFPIQDIRLYGDFNHEIISVH